MASAHERPARYPLVQCLALKQLHYDEGVSVVLLDLVDRTQVGVIKGGCSPGLALESF